MVRQWQTRSPAAAVAASLLAARLAVGRPSASNDLGGSHPAADGGPMSDPPIVAPAWTADFVGVHVVGAISMGGWLSYDGDGGRHRWSVEFAPAYLDPGSAPLKYDVLEADVPGFNHNITVGRGTDSVCHPDRMPRYISLFDGLSTNGRWRGRSVVRGEPCDIWDFNSTDGAAAVSACLARDGVPRAYNTTMNPIFSTAQKAFKGTLTVELVNISVGPPAPGVLDPTDTCEHRYPQPLCPDRGVEALDLFRLHGPEEPRQLTSRNAADAQGNMLFLCDSGVASQFARKGRVVTRWGVRAKSSFGQYSYCFFTNGRNMCMTSSKAVGRESALGIGRGAVQGQCSANDDVGSWYMFPGQGECGRGAGLGEDGCTWGEATPLRTIEVSCLFERGVTEACEQEHGMRPLKRPVKILMDAFADPAEGGCPDAVLPPGGDADGGEVVIV